MDISEINANSMKISRKCDDSDVLHEECKIVLHFVKISRETLKNLKIWLQHSTNLAQRNVPENRSYLFHTLFAAEQQVSSMCSGGSALCRCLITSQRHVVRRCRGRGQRAATHECQVRQRFVYQLIGSLSTFFLRHSNFLQNLEK